MVELEIGRRLGSAGVEGARLCVVERRGCGGQVEMLEDRRHAGRLGDQGDERYLVGAIGASQGEHLVDARDEVGVASVVLGVFGVFGSLALDAPAGPEVVVAAR